MKYRSFEEFEKKFFPKEYEKRSENKKIITVIIGRSKSEM